MQQPEESQEPQEPQEVKSENAESEIPSYADIEFKTAPAVMYSLIAAAYLLLNNRDKLVFMALDNPENAFKYDAQKKLTEFKKGNATSLAPICSGRTKLMRPNISPIPTKKIIVTP